MEEHVGMIANNPNYKLEELERVYADHLNPNSGVEDSPSKGFHSADPNEDGRLQSNSAPGTANPADVLER